MSHAPRLEVSLVVPFYNEVENVAPLHREVCAAMATTGRTWEALYVDDGSTDGTFERLRELTERDGHVAVVRLRRNYGQSAALQAGFDRARGEVLVSLDADLQNDPADIPRLLAALDEDHEVVCGWRRRRHDALVSRKLPSRAANWLIGRLTGVHIHDNGCTLKAYRREVIRRTHLYSDMHRFLGPLLSLSGSRYAEIEVNHRPRRFGVSKYGLSRVWKVFLDLLTLKMVLRFVAHPAGWFFLLALPWALAAAGAGAAALWSYAQPGNAPVVLPSVTVLAVFAGTHLMLAGLIAELVVQAGDFRETQPIVILRQAAEAHP